MDAKRFATRRLVLAVSCAAALLVRPAPVVAQPVGDGAMALNAGTLKFSTLPNVPSCAKIATLRGDPEKGPSVLLQKLTAGCHVPWHWHTPTEQVMVVSGTGQLEMKGAKAVRFQAGSYAFLPSHHAHRAGCTTACMVFVSADGAFDIHYVDAAGNEIPSAEALKPHRMARGRARKR